MVLAAAVHDRYIVVSAAAVNVTRDTLSRFLVLGGAVGTLHHHRRGRNLVALGRGGFHHRQRQSVVFDYPQKPLRFRGKLVVKRHEHVRVLQRPRAFYRFAEQAVSARRVDVFVLDFGKVLAVKRGKVARLFQTLGVYEVVGADSARPKRVERVVQFDRKPRAHTRARIARQFARVFAANFFQQHQRALLTQRRTHAARRKSRIQSVKGRDLEVERALAARKQPLLQRERINVRHDDDIVYVKARLAPLDNFDNAVERVRIRFFRDYHKVIITFSGRFFKQNRAQSAFLCGAAAKTV